MRNATPRIRKADKVKYIRCVGGPYDGKNTRWDIMLPNGKPVPIDRVFRFAGVDGHYALGSGTRQRRKKNKETGKMDRLEEVVDLFEWVEEVP